MHVHFCVSLIAFLFVSFMYKFNIIIVLQPETITVSLVCNSRNINICINICRLLPSKIALFNLVCINAHCIACLCCHCLTMSFYSGYVLCLRIYLNYALK